MFVFVGERSRHAATSRREGVDLLPGDLPKHLCRRSFSAECLLMAVCVNEGCLRLHRAEIEPGSARLRLPHQEFVEQSRCVLEARALLAGEDDGELIPER